MPVARSKTHGGRQAKALGFYFAATATLQVVLCVLVLALPVGLVGVGAWALCVWPMFFGYSPLAFAVGLVGVVFLLGPAIALFLARSRMRAATAGVLAAAISEMCAALLVFLGFEVFGVHI